MFWGKNYESPDMNSLRYSTLVLHRPGSAGPGQGLGMGAVGLWEDQTVDQWELRIDNFWRSRSRGNQRETFKTFPLLFSQQNLPQEDLQTVDFVWKCVEWPLDWTWLPPEYTARNVRKVENLYGVAYVDEIVGSSNEPRDEARATEHGNTRIVRTNSDDVRCAHGFVRAPSLRIPKPCPTASLDLISHLYCKSIVFQCAVLLGPTSLWTQHVFVEFLNREHWEIIGCEKRRPG